MGSYIINKTRSHDSYIKLKATLSVSVCLFVVPSEATSLIS